MKKLTAGIFTVLLGVVAANSADAALTSKAYVDAKVKVNADAIASKADTATVNALDGRVTTAEGTIQTHGTDIADLKTNKQNKLKSGTGIEIDEATNTISTKGIATSDALTTLEGKVTTNTGDITTLKGDGEGSVKKSIADAIAAEVKRSNGAYDAKGAATTAETNAKAYADGLANNYATAAQGKTADNTAAAVNNATTGLATKASKTYVDDELAKKQNTLKQGANITISEDGTIAATYEYDDTALAGRVTILEGTGVTKEKIDAIATNTENIAKKQDALTEAQLNAVNSGITEAKVTTYDGYDAKITAAQTQADKGVEDAGKVATDLSTTKSTLGLLATTQIPAACTDPNNDGCTLVYKQNKFEWELIEREGGK